VKTDKHELHEYLSSDKITVSQNTQDDNGQGACWTCNIQEIKFWLDNLKVSGQIFRDPGIDGRKILKLILTK